MLWRWSRRSPSKRRRWRRRAPATAPATAPHAAMRGCRPTAGPGAARAGSGAIDAPPLPPARPALQRDARCDARARQKTAGGTALPPHPSARSPLGKKRPGRGKGGGNTPRARPSRRRPNHATPPPPRARSIARALAPARCGINIGIGVGVGIGVPTTARARALGPGCYLTCLWDPTAEARFPRRPHRVPPESRYFRRCRYFQAPEGHTRRVKQANRIRGPMAPPAARGRCTADKKPAVLCVGHCKCVLIYSVNPEMYQRDVLSYAMCSIGIGWG